jgi:hypothetical protein
MVRIALSAVLGFLLIGSAFAQLDLTPQAVEYVAEGIKYRQLPLQRWRPDDRL